MALMALAATALLSLRSGSYRLAQDVPLLWYLTRATAVAAYVALTLSVILGMLRAIARTSRERLSWVVDELHAFVATLAGVLIVGHLISLKLHTFIPFTLANLFIPGAQPYRPLAVNLGVLALYAMAALLVTSWIRPLLPYRLWRTIHVLSFVAFALDTTHGLLAGSDAGEIWQRTLYGVAIGAVGFLTLLRLFGGKRAPKAAKEV
jgi:predicted ferric reductase